MEVSVIIPVYNAARYLHQAVISAMDQPETAEIILVEDGSPDNALEVCKSIKNEFEKVRLLQHPDCANHGAGASRNRGILEASYDYIAFLDADDFYLTGRFSAASDLFTTNPNIDGVYDATGIHFESESVEKNWFETGGAPLTTISEPLPPDQLFEALVLGGKGHFTTDAIVVKRSLFNKTGLFDVCLPLHQDTAMWIKMAAVGKLISGNIKTPVAMRRVHDCNRILTVRKGYNALYKKMDELLCQWAEQTGLVKSQIKLLQNRRWVNTFFNYDNWYRAKIQQSSGFFMFQAVRKTAFLFGRLFRCPALMFSPFFVRFVVASFKNIFRGIK